MEDFLTIFGQRVREYRHQKGYSQEILGELVGVSTNTIASWESGNVLLKKHNLEDLCRVLNVSPYDLFARPISKNKIEEGSVLSEILNKVTLLSIEKQKQLLEIVNTFS